MRSIFNALGRFGVKVLHETCASLFGFLLAAAAFWSGWFMHQAYDFQTGGGELRAAQLRCLEAQAAHFERMAEISTVTIPGPEVYTPAEPAAGVSADEPTPAQPQTGTRKTGEEPNR